MLVREKDHEKFKIRVLCEALKGSDIRVFRYMRNHAQIFSPTCIHPCGFREGYSTQPIFGQQNLLFLNIKPCSILRFWPLEPYFLNFSSYKKERVAVASSLSLCKYS